MSLTLLHTSNNRSTTLIFITFLLLVIFQIVLSLPCSQCPPQNYDSCDEARNICNCHHDVTGNIRLGEVTTLEWTLTGTPATIKVTYVPDKDADDTTHIVLEESLLSDTGDSELQFILPVTQTARPAAFLRIQTRPDQTNLTLETDTFVVYTYKWKAGVAKPLTSCPTVGCDETKLFSSPTCEYDNGTTITTETSDKCDQSTKPADTITTCPAPNTMCNNSGSCYPFGDKFANTCKCIDGYEGKWCDTVVKGCSQCDVQHLKECGDNNLCICTQGWKGNLCNEEDKGNGSYVIHNIFIAVFLIVSVILSF